MPPTMTPQYAAVLLARAQEKRILVRNQGRRQEFGLLSSGEWSFSVTLTTYERRADGTVGTSRRRPPRYFTDTVPGLALAAAASWLRKEYPEVEA